MASLAPARRGELLLAGSLVGFAAGVLARLAGARAVADAAWATVAAAAPPRPSGEAARPRRGAASSTSLRLGTVPR